MAFQGFLLFDVDAPLLDLPCFHLFHVDQPLPLIRYQVVQPCLHLCERNVDGHTELYRVVFELPPPP